MKKKRKKTETESYTGLYVEINFLSQKVYSVEQVQIDKYMQGKTKEVYFYGFLDHFFIICYRKELQKTERMSSILTFASICVYVEGTGVEVTIFNF